MTVLSNPVLHILVRDNKSFEYSITTEPLPVNMQQYTFVTSQPAKMAEGVTLFISFFEHSYSTLVDCYGEVRGFVSMPSMAKRMPILLLRNGNMLASGDEYKLTPYNMASLYEYNWLGTSYFVPQTDEISAPNLYVGSLSAEIHEIYRVGDRLVIDGTLLYNGERRLIGRTFLVFRDQKGRVYTYAANSSIQGRFLASVDLTEMPPSVYQLTIAGGLVKGNDALGDRDAGHFKTEYMVTVR